MGWNIMRTQWRKYSFRASNNQLLFNLLTMFENPVTSAICVGLRTCLWGTYIKRGKNDGLQAVILAESLESRYLPRGHFLIKKRRCNEYLLLLCDEDRGVNIGTIDEELMNSSPMRRCSWLSLIFYNARGPVIWGYLDVPAWYKITANVMPQLKVAPVA